MIVAVGHGACSICKCEQFTWDSMMYGGLSPEVDEYIANLSVEIGMTPEELKAMGEEMEGLEKDRDHFQEALRSQSEYSGKLSQQNEDLRERLYDVNLEMKKLKKKLNKICQPFTVAKGKGRSILVDP